MKIVGSLKFSPLGHWFCPWEKFREECRGTFVEPLFCLHRKGEGKQTEPDASLCDIFYDDCVAQLKEVLQVCVHVLARQTTELVCLYHHDEVNLELKVSGACVDSEPNGHVGNNGGGVVAE